MMVSKTRVHVKCPKCDNLFLPSKEEVQSRAGKASRRKGASFENKLAKQIAKWWNQDGEYNYDFKRSPMSGGSALKEGFDMAGDLCSNAPDFRYHIEIKNQPSVFTGLHNIFSEKSGFWKWFDQAESDCPPHKLPILIFNRFDQPTYCAAQAVPRIHNALDRSRIVYNKWYNINLDILVWKYKDMLNSNPENWK